MYEYIYLCIHTPLFVLILKSISSIEHLIHIYINESEYDYICIDIYKHMSTYTNISFCPH
jgi:hypothetical protein